MFGARFEATFRFSGKKIPAIFLTGVFESIYVQHTYYIFNMNIPGCIGGAWVMFQSGRRMTPGASDRHMTCLIIIDRCFLQWDTLWSERQDIRCGRKNTPQALSTWFESARRYIEGDGTAYTSNGSRNKRSVDDAGRVLFSFSLADCATSEQSFLHKASTHKHTHTCTTNTTKQLQPLRVSRGSAGRSPPPRPSNNMSHSVTLDSDQSLIHSFFAALHLQKCSNSMISTLLCQLAVGTLGISAPASYGSTSHHRWVKHPQQYMWQYVIRKGERHPQGQTRINGVQRKPVRHHHSLESP